MRIATWAVLVAVLSCTGTVRWAEAQAGLKVCADPSDPCRSPHKTFAAYELSLQLPRTIRGNVDYKSVPFYAVVVKTFPPGDKDACDQGEYTLKIERERRQLQTRFPKRKVFASYQCPDMGALSYVTSSGPFNLPFLGIYGGTTKKDAAQVRASLMGRYPHATVRRMQVVFNKIAQ